LKEDLTREFVDADELALESATLAHMHPARHGHDPRGPGAAGGVGRLNSDVVPFAMKM
jgi:hypothetical protein